MVTYGNPIHFSEPLKEQTQPADAASAQLPGYDVLFERAPFPMWICDAETLQFAAVNLAALKRYGWSREEFDAVHIEGSVLLSQEAMREIMADGSNTRPLVIVDHQGKTALDAAAYFMGHGLQNVRCLRGGIDAWAQEVDPKMRRYELR